MPTTVKGFKTGNNIHKDIAASIFKSTGQPKVEAAPVKVQPAPVAAKPAKAKK